MDETLRPETPKVKLGGAFHVGVEVDGIEWSTSRYWRPPGNPASLFSPPKKTCATKKNRWKHTFAKNTPKNVLRFVEMNLFGGFEIRLEFVAGKKTNMQEIWNNFHGLPPSDCFSLPMDETSFAPAWGW